MPHSRLTRLPGLADVHVHLRVPGGEHKEDFSTGTAAAIAGGFTTVLAMPNTTPPLVTRETLRTVQQQARAAAWCDVHFYAGASPDHLDELPALAQETVGLKIYADQTYGPLRIDNLATLLRCFQTWPPGKPIAMHAEGRSIAMGIGLAAAFRQRVHFCHVSRADEITLIAAAKGRGLPITCEVTPHHLFLTEADAARLGPFGDMRPRLTTQANVDALWARIFNTIDCIATDHAPHTRDEKLGPDAPPGIPGLETALPLMLTAVADGRLTLERLVELMASNPRRIFGLPEQPETWIEVAPDAAYTLSDEGLQTKCGWSPFSGMAVRGKVERVKVHGALIFDKGAFVHPPKRTRY
ncbi:MAG: amidohydrolase family protein [Anaerolineae bacterium]